MIRRFFAFFVVIGIGFAVFAPVQEPVLLAMPAKNPPATPWAGGLATPDQLLHLVNTERKKSGIAPLHVHHRLNGSAQRKADDMAMNNYFGHVNPHNGSFGPHYALEAGVGCSYTAENLSRSGDGRAILNAVQAVNSWMGSPPHREALLNPEYLITGFGISGAYIVEHFCSF